MPSIAVFRVSREHKKFRFSRILLIILLILSFWLLVYIYSYLFKFVKLVCTNLLNSTDCLIFKSFIADTIPIFKIKIDSRYKTENYLDETMRDFFLLKVFDFKKVLSEQYPLLYIYYLNPPELLTLKKDGLNSLSKNQVINHQELSVEDEREIHKEQLKDDFITIIRCGDIVIRNHTDYRIDIEKLKTERLKFKLNPREVGIIIIHTHTSESYSPSFKINYNSNELFRTEDSRYNVVRVGRELSKELAKYRIKTFHDTTSHDFPTYTGSYKRSLQTTLADIKKYPAAKIVLDIHRDALNNFTERFRPVCKIKGTEIAKLMIVVGTDRMGLEHPYWRENLKFAIKLQEKGNQLYPGLFKEIDLRKERFNQHVAPGALIIEVGGTGNTLEEALASMKYLAKVIAEVVQMK